jgi:hypothetical protein
MTEKLTYFALVDDTNTVIRTFVMDHDKAQSGLWGDPARLIEYTNYTSGGVYYGQDNIIPIRKNSAAVGYTYDQTRDAFIAPQPYPSWILNNDTCCWEAPVPYPTDGNGYVWDETTQTWVIPNV